MRSAALRELPARLCDWCAIFAIASTYSLSLDLAAAKWQHQHIRSPGKFLFRRGRRMHRDVL